MDARLDIITVIAIVVLLLVAFRLRSVLGRRTQDDEARIDRKIRAEQEAESARQRAEAQGKVVTLPRAPDAGEAPAGMAGTTTTAADIEARYKTAAGGNTAVQNGLLAIHRTDSSFEPEHFMRGGRQAYEMIVTAFAEGNRKVLRDLLSNDVFDRFAAAISDRESRGEVMDQSFVGINKADIVEAEVRNGTAEVTVRFASQLISAVRNKTGQVVSGDPQKITDVTDVWTFAREIKARNPNWRLVATQSVE